MRLSAFAAPWLRSRSCHFKRRLSRVSLTPDPFTDVGWAIGDSYPVQFVDRQKIDGFTVDQLDVFEIEGQYASFFFQ